MGKAAAKQGYKVVAVDTHVVMIPSPSGPVATAGPFQRPPSNQGSLKSGSATVLFENKQAAHTGDPALTCNDPSDTLGGTVIGSGSVLVGD